MLGLLATSGTDFETDAVGRVFCCFHRLSSSACCAFLVVAGWEFVAGGFFVGGRWLFW